MVWRRSRGGKTRQLIIFIFILIFPSVTSNNLTHTVYADVMSTSFADKLCLHISTPAAYMTAPSLSWYRLLVFRAQHGFFFRFRDTSAHFFGIYCRNPNLPLNGSKCSSIQPAEPTKYNDLHNPMNMSQISRNAATLSSKRRSVLVAFSSNLIIDKRNRKRFFAMTTEKINLPVPSILYSDSMCSCKDSNTSP